MPTRVYRAWHMEWHKTGSLGPLDLVVRAGGRRSGCGSLKASVIACNGLRHNLSPQSSR